MEGLLQTAFGFRQLPHVQPDVSLPYQAANAGILAEVINERLMAYRVIHGAGSLEEPGTGRHQTFVDLDALFGYLCAETAAPPLTQEEEKR